MLSESAKEEFQDIHCENPNVVIVGLAPTYFCYEEVRFCYLGDTICLCMIKWNMESVLLSSYLVLFFNLILTCS